MESIKRQALVDGELVRVLYPLKPVIFGHFLVMPKRHVATFTDLTDDELSEIKAQILGLHDAFNRAGKAADYNLLSNNGEAADQHILHVHIHVFMRSQNDVSPFDILSRKSDRETQSETEWTAQVTKLCALLSAK